MVYAAAESHIVIAYPKAVYGLVQSRYGAGARRVYGKTGAVKIENVGYAPGYYVGQFAGHAVFRYRQELGVDGSFDVFNNSLLLGRRQNGEMLGMP